MMVTGSQSRVWSGSKAANRDEHDGFNKLGLRGFEPMINGVKFSTTILFTLPAKCASEILESESSKVTKLKITHRHGTCSHCQLR